jgi:hypothetical protein
MRHEPRPEIKMKHKKLHKLLVISMIFSMLFITAYSQDLSGYWQGRFRTDQRRNGASKTFFMNMVLIQNGRKIEGRFGNSALDFPNNPDVVYEISGIIGKKEKIPSRLIRGRILYSRLFDEVAEYFLSLDDIKYDKNDSIEVLYGNWSANGLIPLRSDGFAGSFWVSRLRRSDTLKKAIVVDTSLAYHSTETIGKEPDIVLIPAQMMKRKNSEAGRITLHTKKITLNIYDNGTIDGDSVSIFFNGKLLLSHQLVSEKPITLNLELDENLVKNEIILFAENLGSISPNTALIVVNAGDKRYELLSNADLGKNAVLVIEYHQNE